MFFKFWGTRGSIPVPGKNTLKYGGNTPCVEFRSSNNKLIILDAGSGIRELRRSLIEKEDKNHEIHIFISHYHWDHIQGIPFFLPLYEKDTQVIFHGLTSNGSNIEDILSNQMNDNFFPIKIDDVNAQIRFERIEADHSYKIDEVKIETFRANHSTPTLAYKLSENDKSVVYMTDNELKYKKQESIDSVEELNRNVIDFCRGCDYLVHDTMYDEIQILQKKGWGHSSNVLLAYFSIIAEIKNLVLFHYNPDYTDEKIEKMLKETEDIFHKEKKLIECFAAKEGLEIKV
jgi:phosphoribosyl 1,2-cyclic phosphodiesterase